MNSTIFLTLTEMEVGRLMFFFLSFFEVTQEANELKESVRIPAAVGLSVNTFSFKTVTAFSSKEV